MLLRVIYLTLTKTQKRGEKKNTSTKSNVKQRFHRLKAANVNEQDPDLRTRSKFQMIGASSQWEAGQVSHILFHKIRIRFVMKI